VRFVLGLAGEQKQKQGRPPTGERPRESELLCAFRQNEYRTDRMARRLWNCVF
jgi:hypothetical protein